MKWNILCVVLLGLLALSNGFKLFDRTRSNEYGTKKQGQQQEARLAEKRGRRPDVVALIADRIDQQLMNCYYSPRLDEYVYTNRDVLEVLVTLLRQECPENGGHTDGYNGGHTDGYNGGHTDGYNGGYTDGYNGGYMDGYGTTSGPFPSYMYPYGKKRTFVKELAEILKQRGFDHTSGPHTTEEKESHASISGSTPPGSNSGTSQSDTGFSTGPRPTGYPSNFGWE